MLSRKSPAVVSASFQIWLREERETLTSVRSIVFAPHTIKDLIAIDADFGTFEPPPISGACGKQGGEQSQSSCSVATAFYLLVCEGYGPSQG